MFVFLGFPSSIKERQCGTIFVVVVLSVYVCIQTQTHFKGNVIVVGVSIIVVGLCLCHTHSILKEELRKFFDFSCKIKDSCMCLWYCHNFVDEQFVIDIYIPLRVFLLMYVCRVCGRIFVDVMWWVIVQSPSSIFAHIHILFSVCVFLCSLTASLSVMKMMINLNLWFGAP